MRYAAVLIAAYAILLFAKRVIFPDIACDSINYHVFLGKAAVENFPHLFQKAEFYPLGMHSFNPTLDTVTYLLSQLFGYRLGTVGSLLAFLGCLILSVRIASIVIGQRLTIATALLFVPALVVNEGFFQLATYYTDNIYAFLVLLSVFLVFSLGKASSISALFAHTTLLGLLTGLLCTKLTNIIYVLPLFFSTLAAGISALNKLHVSAPSRTALSASFFYILALLPLPALYWLDAYLQTGNPLFPYYNDIYQSPYYSTARWAFNYGPTTWIQRAFYPLFAIADPKLLGEVKDLFPDLKLIIAWIFFLCLLIVLFFRKQRWQLQEAFFIAMIIFSFLLWQGLFGYVRYAIALEYLLGLGIILLVVKIGETGFPAKATILLYGLLAAGQSVSILSFNSHYDIAWRPAGLPTTEIIKAWSAPTFFARQTSYPDDIASTLRNTEIVLQCVSPSSAYPVTFPELRDKPMLNLFLGTVSAIPFTAAYAQQRDGVALAALDKTNSNRLNFALIVNDTNKPLNLFETCKKTLAQIHDEGGSVHVTNHFVVDNFVGDTRQQLQLLTGEYTPAPRPLP
ncbi:MAG: hypothetical protein AB7U29_02190 [Desulfobulbus sp.]